jgi:hypothetical protein
MLPNFPPNKGSGLLLDLIKADTFEKTSEPEKKALFAALAQLRSEQTEKFIYDIFQQKSGVFAKKRVDEFKLLAIGGIESTPSVPGLQLLAAVAQDPKSHSKDVIETARAAVVNVKTRLLGAG